MLQNADLNDLKGYDQNNKLIFDGIYLINLAKNSDAKLLQSSAASSSNSQCIVSLEQSIFPIFKSDSIILTMLNALAASDSNFLTKLAKKRLGRLLKIEADLCVFCGLYTEADEKI